MREIEHWIENPQCVRGSKGNALVLRVLSESYAMKMFLVLDEYLR